MAGWALRSGRVNDQLLEPMPARSTLVFVNRHLSIMRDYYISTSVPPVMRTFVWVMWGSGLPAKIRFASYIF